MLTLTDLHSPLEQVETFKYLRVLLSSDLSWSSHIDFICTKARKLIGLLYRRFYGNVDNHSLLELYSVLVHPHLVNAAPSGIRTSLKILTNLKVFKGSH